MLALDSERSKTFATTVNREVQRAMSGGPPSMWAVFPRGTVCLFPVDAGVGVSDVAVEAQRHLEKKSTSSALNVRAYSHNGWWWISFEESVCGANVFCVIPVQEDQDILDAVRVGLYLRLLDSGLKVSGTSNNFSGNSERSSLCFILS